MAHSLPGPEDIYRLQLDNGIVVLSRANFNSPSVVINGYLQVGALFDSDEKLGLADFTAQALKRGASRHSFQEIYDLLESVGASLGLSSGTHTTSFSGKALSEDLDLLLEMLSEVLRQPVFPIDQVERLRTQILTGLAIRAQDTADMAALAFDQLVYQNHPYRRPEDGYPETVRAIQQADLVDFHRLYYGPRGMVITVVGAVEPQRAAEKVAQVLGDWQNLQQPDAPALPFLEPLSTALFQRVTIPGKAQSDLVIGAAGPARTSPDYLPASLGNNILGQFGMMGRVGEAVREKAGLAYYASSSLAGGPGPGPWEISAGVNPENVQPAIDLIRQEIRRFTSQLVEPEELEDSQSSYIGILPLSLESNHGVAHALLNLERYQLGLDYYPRYPDLVRAVRREEVLEAARRYLDPERLAVAVAGS
jgi:zinc protease